MDTPIDGFLVQLIQAVHWNFDGLNFIFDKLGEHYTLICSLATKFLKQKPI